MTKAATRGAALIGTTVSAVALMASGAVLSAGNRSHGAGRAGVVRAPVEIPVRVAVLDPSTGAVIWSSLPLSGHVMLNPSTGSVLPPPAGERTPVLWQRLPVLLDDPTDARRG